MEEKTRVHIWKAPKGYDARYVTVTESGEFILGFRKLSEVRERYHYQIEMGTVELVRELDKVYQLVSN